MYYTYRFLANYEYSYPPPLLPTPSFPLYHLVCAPGKVFTLKGLAPRSQGITMYRSYVELEFSDTNRTMYIGVY